MIYCSQCGREHQNHANFCGGCGNQLRANVTAATRPAKLIDKLTTKKTNPIFLIISAVVWFYLLLVPFMIYFYSVTDGSLMFWLAEEILIDPGEVIAVLLFVDGGIFLYVAAHHIYSRLWQRSKWFKFFSIPQLIGSILGVIFAGIKFFRFLYMLVSGSSDIFSEISGYNTTFITYVLVFGLVHYALFTAFFLIILTKSIKQLKRK